jgi:hypothetical protein
MAEKKVGTAKSPTVARPPVGRGASYLCEVRGRTTPVDQSCECAQFCDVACSGGPMSVRPVRAAPDRAPVRMVGDF